MAETVNVHYAKTHLSELLKRVESGDEVIIARDSKPVAKLVAVPQKPKPQFGRLRGKVKVGPEFFEPLPDDELRAWGEEP